MVLENMRRVGVLPAAEAPVLYGSTLHTEPIQTAIDRSISNLADGLCALEQTVTALGLTWDREAMLVAVQERIAAGLDDPRRITRTSTSG